MGTLYNNFNDKRYINFVLLPQINNIIKRIDSSHLKNIILVGVRKSGKTTTLINYKNKHQLNGDIIITPDFDRISDMIMTTDERKLEVELIICEKLVEYIYNKKTLDFFQKLILDAKRELYGKCMARIYMDDKDNNIETGFIIKSIIKQLEKENKKKIILIIDKFDYINNSNKVIQKILTSFFPLFSKNILISEDESILNCAVVERLKNNGYDVININYLRNISIIKKIIELRMKKNKCISSNLSILLKNECIEYLIKLSNGNFDVMFYIIDEINNLTNQLDYHKMLEFMKEKAKIKNDIYSLLTEKKLRI